jgi:hypothetical protein
MFQPRSFTRIRTLVFTGVCVTALGLSACGGGDDSSTSSTPATGATGASSSADVSQAREEFTAGLLDAMAQDEALTDAQKECVKNELQNAITDEMLQQAQAAGQVTDEMRTASLSAGAACAGQ